MEYILLSICSKNVHNTCSWLIQPFAEKPRQELLSGCIWLGPMWWRTILSPFISRTSQFAIPIWIGWVNTFSTFSFSYSAHCTLWSVVCTTVYLIHYTFRLCLYCVNWVLSVSRHLATLPQLAPSGGGKHWMINLKILLFTILNLAPTNSNFWFLSWD